MKTGKELLEDIGTGIADMMGTQPINVVGRKERKGTEKKATYNETTKWHGQHKPYTNDFPSKLIKGAGEEVNEQ